MTEHTLIFNLETEEQIITVSPTIRFDEKLKEEILSQVLDEGMVIVYCLYKTEEERCLSCEHMIWMTTDRKKL